MLISKFIAEASLGNYRNAYLSRKYKNSIDSSMIIESQYIPSSCTELGCRTERCKYICGLSPIQWCEGTLEACSFICCGDLPNSYYECYEATYSTYCS